MASVINRPGGVRWVQFIDSNEKKQTLRLGKVSKRIATGVKLHVENLVGAKAAGQPVDPTTVQWVAGLDNQRLIARLVRFGLISSTRSRGDGSLGDFLAAFIDGRSDLEPSTIANLQRVRRDLLAFFGSARQLRSITAGDADDFRLYLLGHGRERPLDENSTARRAIGRCKEFFSAAMRKKLIVDNPFSHLKSAVLANPARFHFITREDSQRILDACPDAQWRLIFALSRWGGLRCPSEHLALRWRGVNWEQGKMLVWSPKTKRHPGGESRLIPIFPELRPHLDAAWDEAADSADFIITRYRGTNCNLRTQMLRIIRRAGVKPWPRLFNNLRSTRETELVEAFPIHVACAWIGNSESVAKKHYLQITDSHFAAALTNQIAKEQPADAQTEKRSKKRSSQCQSGRVTDSP